ncbi:MAG TPA: nucleotide pyrophosphohydrolase [archaeon]|nr:nucleotide pyrophosphohydrolase [archaeon]
MSKLSINEAQELVDNWINQFEEGYWPPLSMFAALVEEVGELAEEINSLEGYKPKKPEDSEIDIEMELGDILFALICISNYYNIDLDHALKKVLEKYNIRDLDRWTLKSDK